MNQSTVQRFVRRSILGVVVGSAMAALPCQWALAAQPPADEEEELEEVIISGLRLSLQQSADAKREAVGFTDSIFAEDIGKFPDNNIAESLNRIPGVTIVRDINGAGVNVAIRGLGTSFTRVLLNNTPILVGSTGRTGAQSVNREVDLAIFPSELFTHLEVSKSPQASMLEGGAAGVVNLRSARPFDREGFNARYSLEGQDNSNAGSNGVHGSLLVSNTWGAFGALAGVSFARDKTRILGYESVGWTNPNLSTPQSLAGTTNGVQNPVTQAHIDAAQCITGCNSTGGGNWSIPGTVPANAGIPGVATGTVISDNLLLQLNPGLTLQQIDNAIVPRLNRPVDDFGENGNTNAIVSLEYRPTDDLRFYLDSMYGRKTMDLQRIDINWVGRNGAVIPANMQVDRTDCSAGCVATAGTYYNAQFFLEYRPWIETTRFWGFNPGLSWQINDRLKLDLQANGSHSTHRRETPTVLPITAPSSGVTVTYSNPGGAAGNPVVTTNIDLDDPANFIWNTGRVNIQDETRFTGTKGARFDLTWGDAEDLGVKFGGAWDNTFRRIRAFDNSQAWQNAVCGNDPNVFVPGPNTQPPCAGLDQAGAAPAGHPTYPGLGTGYTAGYTTPLAYRGSLIPTAELPSFLMPGPSGFVTLDWDAFRAASAYDLFHDTSPEAGGSNSGASAGYVREKVTGLYMQIDGQFDALGSLLRYNLGVRYVDSEQIIGGRTSIVDPRNAAQNLQTGGQFPAIVTFPYTNTKYDNILPSLNVAYNLGEHAVARLALSKSMTRANPSTMLPGLNFSSPSADIGTVGNPDVDPYTSKNIDLGLDIYTGGPGYISLTAFRKEIKGFTQNGSTTVPFSALAFYGVTYDTLSPTQQTALNARGGPSSATVVLTQQVNASGLLTVNGLEVGWVQPLDELLEPIGVRGMGFMANMTIIDQKGTGAAPAVALGVAPRTYNTTLWYEQHGISARVSYNFARGSQVALGNQNGIAAAALFGDDYQQWDFSSSFDLRRIFGLSSDLAPEVTFDVLNLTKEKQRSYFQFSNAANDVYNPGRMILLGVRGKF